MSTDAPATTAASGAPAIPSAIGCAGFWNVPTQDHHCAIPARDNATDIMNACCGEANIISYGDDCGLYCLAIDQTEGDLQECLANEGAVHGQFACAGNDTASATATGPGEVPASASASLVASGSSSNDDDDDDDSSSNGSGSGSGGSSDDDDDDDDDDSAAAGVKPIIGLTIGALLFSATAFGAFTI